MVCLHEVQGREYLLLVKLPEQVLHERWRVAIEDRPGFQFTVITARFPIPRLLALHVLTHGLLERLIVPCSSIA